MSRFAARKDVGVLQILKLPNVLRAALIRAAISSDPMKEFIDGDACEFSGERYYDGAWIGITGYITCAPSLLEHLWISAKAIQVKLRGIDQFSAILANIARLNYGNPTIKAIVSTGGIGLDEETHVDVRYEIEMRKSVQNFPPKMIVSATKNNITRPQNIERFAMIRVSWNTNNRRWQTDVRDPFGNYINFAAPQAGIRASREMQPVKACLVNMIGIKKREFLGADPSE
jgi:hypothetical protein